MKQAPRPFSSLLRLLALTALMSTSAAYANEYAEITQLLKAGKPADALVKTEQRLISTPRDPQLRFLRGVAQADSGKTLEAIASFTRLTEDYPELPEPYNNLAVLYANQNQLDKARIALEMAIRTNPSYATAHENMGDIYAKLASQAYNKALQLDASNANSLKPKLALIRELFAPEVVGKGGRKTTVATTAPLPTAAPAAVAVAPTVAPSVPPTTPPPVAAVNKPADAPTASTGGDAASEQEVVSAVNAWAQAWESKNMSAYLAAYGKDFVPPNKASRAAWAKEREDRIVSKNKITVQLSDINVKVTGDKAVVRFRQAYRGDSFSSNGRKTLELTKTNGRWTISKEAVGG
jgi:tetratricopeptide (TPR) repeat protein